MHSQPADPIEGIFARLVVAYGRDFLARYQGLNMDVVKGDWHRELQPWLDNERALLFALDSLPADKPPTAPQFRALCRACPPVALRPLPPPKMAPDEAAPYVAAARAVRQQIAERAAQRRLRSIAGGAEC